jgi:hypothetical protein
MLGLKKGCSSYGLGDAWRPTDDEVMSIDKQQPRGGSLEMEPELVLLLCIA